MHHIHYSSPACLEALGTGSFHTSDEGLRAQLDRLDALERKEAKAAGISYLASHL